MRVPTLSGFFFTSFQHSSFRVKPFRSSRARAESSGVGGWLPSFQIHFIITLLRTDQRGSTWKTQRVQCNKEQLPRVPVLGVKPAIGFHEANGYEYKGLDSPCIIVLRPRDVIYRRTIQNASKTLFKAGLQARSIFSSQWCESISFAAGFSLYRFCASSSFLPPSRFCVIKKKRCTSLSRR